MSTLMSKDIHLERPSTKLHAPPGGQSSFSIGDQSGVDDRFGAKRNYQGKSTTGMGSILGGSQQQDENAVSGRRGYNQSNNSSSLGDLISGSDTSKPSSARGRRQAPGGTSSIVIG